MTLAAIFIILVAVSSCNSFDNTICLSDWQGLVLITLSAKIFIPANVLQPWQAWWWKPLSPSWLGPYGGSDLWGGMTGSANETRRPKPLTLSSCQTENSCLCYTRFYRTSLACTVLKINCTVHLFLITQQSRVQQSSSVSIPFYFLWIYLEILSVREDIKK
jgi:hypothetical protein